MRKALVIITAVALLGILAAYAKPASTSESAGATDETTVVAGTPTGSTATSSQASTTSPSTSLSSGDASASATTAGYSDGTFQGTDARNRFGDVQVSVKISGGKIIAVTFDQLDANDQHSEQINSYASSKLVSQTIAAQGANIAGVSGATYTSDSYMQSLQAALDKAGA